MDDLLNKLLGNWYKENIYYKYRIHKMPLWKSNLARLFFLPMGLWHGFISSIHNRFEQAHVEMPITTRCNFLCRDCSNLIPYFKNPADFDLKMLIRDIDDFLSHVDRVHRFIIMGGETFLYRDLHALIKLHDKTTQNRFDTSFYKRLDHSRTGHYAIDETPQSTGINQQFPCGSVA